MAEKKENAKKEDKEDVIRFNFHNILKGMWLTPEKFFRSDKEKEYQPLLRMFVLFYLFYLVIVQVVSFVYGNFNPTQGIIAIAIGTFFSVVVAFAFSGVMHLILILSGSKTDFFNTYKAGIYTLTFWVFYSIVILLISLVLPFDTQGFQDSLLVAQESKDVFKIGINFLKSNPVSLLSLLISLAIHLHILVFGIKSLRHFNKLSTGKASFVVATTALLLFVVQILLVYYLVANSGAGATP